MNALKIFKTWITVLVIAVLAGCSDQLVSTDSAPQGSQPKEQVNEYQDLKTNHPFHTVIRLKPFKTVTFNYHNTGISEIKTVQVEPSTESAAGSRISNCDEISVYTRAFNVKSHRLELGCKNDKISVSEISIENKSSKFQEIDVILTGIRGSKVPVQE